VRHLPLLTVCVLSLGLLLWNLKLQDARVADTVWAGSAPDEIRMGDGELSVAELSPRLVGPLAKSGGVDRRVPSAAGERTGGPPDGTVAGSGSAPPRRDAPELGPAFAVEVFDLHSGGLSTGVRTRAGARTGLWQQTWPDGALRWVGAYVEDERDGPWEFFYEDGAKHKVGAYAEGRREDLWSTWHRNGERMQAATYRQGRMAGFWREWFSNGQVREAGRYLDGRREGWWQFFHYDGAIDIRTGMYAAGRRLGR